MSAVICKSARQFHDERFTVGSHPRSEAYKAGCLAGLQRFLGEPNEEQPHPPGTAEADAWWSGHEGARVILQSHAESDPDLNERLEEVRAARVAKEEER